MDFRQYDNALGKFYGMDALSEKNHYLSPFQFGNGNPVFWADPTGLDSEGGYDPKDCYGKHGAGSWIKNYTDKQYNSIDAGGSGSGGGYSGTNAMDLMDKLWKATPDGYNSTFVNRGNGNFKSIATWGTGTPMSEFYNVYTLSTGAIGSFLLGTGMEFSEVIINTKRVARNIESKSLRKYSGYALAINKPLELAFRSGTMYPSQLYPSHTSNVVFQKNILGYKVHIPLGEYRTSSIGKASNFLKITGKALGIGAVALGGYDILTNGLNISNGLDTTMALLAVSPTGVGQAIAGVYFLSNTISILTTGKDIGQHIQNQIDGN